MTSVSACHRMTVEGDRWKQFGRHGRVTPMRSAAARKQIDSIARELDFRDANELVRDSLMNEISFRLAKFSDEVARFERKHGKKLAGFKREYESREEGFGRYDDLMAWEFARQGKEHWEKRLGELKRVL